ncbi:GntR family transcriptional regulator [Streptosporangium canum]|uniref:GntR family transcriptional regulator n=1 Tax=Streptosporangium canum TaxID=324952 RepID=UPI003413EE2E
MAAELREDIVRGVYRAGTMMPSLDEICVRFSVGKATAAAAYKVLEAEGLVTTHQGRGTIVLSHPDLIRLTVRSRQIERDAYGYYSGPEVMHWRALPHADGTLTRVITAPVPADVAEILGVTAGAPLTVRRRIVGDPKIGEHRQLADSWLAPRLVEELPALSGDTGLGGTYDRVEEWAGRPLAWREEVSARIPSPDEAEALRMPVTTPMLRVVRVTTLPEEGQEQGGRVIEVQDIRMSSARFAVGYPLLRGESARWPVSPATGDYYSAATDEPE